MKQNGNNIIFDDDVTLTGGNAGDKLSNKLGGLSSRVTKLESYLKWLYGHGGVGGGTGSGGGGGSSTGQYSLYATLNDVQIKDQNTISLSEAGYYPLYFKIQNPAGATYSVVYKYSEINSLGVEITKSERITLDINNSYEFSKSIHLNNNANLTITATDSVYNITKQVSARYITNTYSIKTKFVNNLGEDPGSEIYIINAQQNGLNVIFTYDFAITASFTTHLSFNIGSRVIETEPTTIVTDNQNKTGEIKYDLVEIGKKEGWEVVDENSGLYTATVTTDIKIEGAKVPPQVDVKTFTLIPSSLYLLVQHATGEIYQSDTEPNIEPDKIYDFYVGNVVFNTRAYYGTAQGQSCTITYKVNDDTKPLSFSSTLREQNQVKVFLSKEGWNKIQFNLSSNNAYYPSMEGYVTYWVHTKKPESRINWPTIERNPDGTYEIFRKSGGAFSFYRQGEQWGGSTIPGIATPPLTSLRDKASAAALIMTSTKDPFTVSDIRIPDVSALTRNTVLFLGLKYSEINKDGIVIVSGEKEISGVYRQILTISQEKITIGNTEIKYFFPKTRHEDYAKDDKYHLLTIVSRYIKTSGNTSLYELMVYIDGRLESAAKTYSQEDFYLDRITFNPCNCIYNLVEIDYLNANFRKELVNGELQDTKDCVPEDLMVFQYWLKYRSSIVDPINRPATDREINLLTHCDTCDILNEGEVLCTYEGIANIALDIGVPTLMFTIKDDGTTKAQLDQGYKEGDNLPVWDVNVSWANGKGGELTPVVPDPVKFPQARFTIKPQGSSTLHYKCKNFTLSLLNGNDVDTDEVYVFSPNFNSKDKTTFLPEESFTLKADVVDSSHSNNTSIGRFVNNITTKFDTLDTSSLSGYVKNCLDGFPMVVYIDLARETTGPNGVTVEHKYYYQGIYNFNLGRSSFYNLGYKDSKVFLDANKNIDLANSDGGFTFYKVKQDDDTLKDGLIVAEIQGNSPYFDFSQWDQTILYQTYTSGSVDSEPYMFGDFVSGPNLEETRSKSIIQRLVYNVSKAGGYLFNDHLKKRFSEDPKTHCGYDQGYCAKGDLRRPMYEKEPNGDYKLDAAGNKIPILGEDGLQKYEVVNVPLNQVPNYRKHYVKAMNGTEIVYNLAEVTEGEFNMDAGGPGHLQTLIIGDKDAGEEPWFDYQSLSEYYTICMAFGLIDSVQKNMNIKSWTGTWDNQLGKGRAKFYAAFYDMDTCLGINNAGTDTSYFAFSDYWQYNDSASGVGMIKPGQVTIFRDYSPPADSSSGDKLTSADFYDTPSSYLFAVAKYAVLDGAAGDAAETTNWPKELWAKWRSSTENNADPTQACLRSAEYFIDNYFANNIDAVSIPMVNMNYRNKYFVKDKDSNTFSNTNFAKFNGTRIAKATDWLNGRFHILDAYFNLPKATNPIQCYDSENIYGNIIVGYGDSGIPIYKGEPNYSGTSYALNSNTDITILQDIFNENPNSTKQGSGNLTFNIKAKEYSPFIINTANNSFKYLLEGGDMMYNVILTLSGMQTYNFYGSGAWTSLDSIDSFEFRDLYINSKYLTTLSGTSKSNKMVVNGSSIVMPSLESLTLNGPNFTGNIIRDGRINNERYPNLNSIDVSGNAVNVEIKDSSCTRINISKKSGNSTVSITECPELTELIIGTGDLNIPATTLSNLVISPLTLPLCKTTSKNNTEGGFTLNYCRIYSLTLTNKSTTTENPTSEMGSTRLCITNDYDLTTLSIGGFSQVYIRNCPNLREISISDPRDGEGGDYLQLLHIQQCGNTLPEPRTFSINKDSIGGAPGKCLLTGYKYLRSLSITSCGNVVEICLPEHAIDLPTRAFAANGNMKYLSGGSANVNDLYLLGYGTFTECTSFTLKGSDGKYTKLMVHADNTSLENTFTSSRGAFTGSIDIDAARYFIENCIPKNNNITNITNLFYGQKIVYNEGDLISDLRGSTKKYLDMSVFKKATNVNSALSWCKISAWHPKMFEIGLENGGATINFHSYARLMGHTKLTTTVDILKHIIDKVDFLFQEGYDHFIEFRFVDNLGQFLGMSKENPVNLYDFFHPGGKHPKRVKKISYIGMDTEGGRHYDWRKTILDESVGVFDVGWDSLTTIACFMHDKTYGDEQLNISEMFLKLSGPGTKLDSLYEVLSFKLTTPINLFTLFDWVEVAKKNTNYFSGRRTNDNTAIPGYCCLNMNKYVTAANFEIICRLIGSGSLTGLEGIFKNAYVLSGSFDPIPIVLGRTDKPNRTILSTDFLFCNMKAVNIGNEVSDPTEETLQSLEKKDRIYFNISNTFQNIYNLVRACGTFQGLSISESLPYNFFNKRYRTSDSEIYIVTKEGLPEDQVKFKWADYQSYFEKAELFRYRYNQHLEDVSECFRGTKWLRDDIDSKVNARRFNGTAADIEADYIQKKNQEKLFATKNEPIKYYKLVTEPEFVYDPETDTDKIEYVDYLIFRQSQLLDVEDNTEITDLTEFIPPADINDSGKYTYQFTLFNSKGGQKKITNFLVADSDDVGAGSSLNKLFCPPDILYGCKASCRIYYLFSNDSNSEETLEGTIPANLLKYCKSSEITDMMKNLNILPRFLWSEKSNSGDNVTIRNIYHYVPANFTSSSNLSYAFNFHLMMPGPRFVKVNPSGNGNTVTITAFYVLLNESIGKNVVSLAYGFPNVYKSLYYKDTPSIWADENGNLTNTYDPHHYGLMYIPKDYSPTERKYEGSGEDGINITGKFTNLRVDNLIQEALASELYGKIFDSSFYLQNAMKALESNYIIDSLTWVAYNRISANIIFPRLSPGASLTDRHIIRMRGSGALPILKSQILNGSETGVDKAYETIKDGVSRVKIVG